MSTELTGKTILITGGTGSWGNELVRQLLEHHNPSEIRIYSRGEHKQVDMKRNFPNEKKLKYFIGDVRDKDRLLTTMRDVDYVFHLAALKHVPVCEENPWESVQTNVVGCQNVIDAAIENEVTKVVDISTDKAVDPFNLYGTCKAVGEKLMIAANLTDCKTRFVCIRGGNVLGTNGSVVPLFRNQILKSGIVTITDPNMTRYMMNLPEAVNLIFKATFDSVGGEIFVMKMPSLRVQDLAESMIEELGKYRSSETLKIDEEGDQIKFTKEVDVQTGDVKIKHIGIRAGEKMHEVLVSKYEAPNAIEQGNYFVILPMITLPEIQKKYSELKRAGIEEFNSQNAHVMSKEEIKKMLDKDGWLNPGTEHYDSWISKVPAERLEKFFELEGFNFIKK